MSRSSVEIEELLTGLIDGQLSEAERLEIDDRLGKDQQLQATFKALKRNRDLVTAVPKSQSPRFSSKIVALAKERALESSAPVPTWLQGPQVRRSAAYSQPWWKKHSVSLAIAAAITFVLASGMALSLLRQSLRQSEIATNVSQETQPEKASEVSQPTEVVAPALAGNDNATKAPVESVPTPIVPEQPVTPVESSIASNESVKTPIPETQEPSTPNVAPADPAVENALANVTPNTDDPGADFALGDLFMVVDVTASTQIDTMERFNVLLGRYDIAMAEDMNVDQPVVNTLEKARLLQGQSALNTQQTLKSSTSLLFVKARAVRIDAMVEEMIADVEGFPEISLSVLMDTPELPLLGELKSVQEAELSRSQKQSVASSVASPLRSRGGSRSFVSAQRQQPAMPLEERRSSKGRSGILMGDASNPVTYVLFVVRSSQ